MLLTRIFLFTFICFSSLSAFAQSKETYIDTKNDFCFQYPDNWEVEEAEQGVVTIFSPYEADVDSEEIDNIEEKIQITISQWDEGSIEEFIEVNFSLESMNEVFYNFSIFKGGKEIINNLESHWFLFAYETEQEETMAGLEYFIKNKNKIITMIGICSTDDYEPIYKDIYLEIIRSSKSYINSRTR